MIPQAAKPLGFRPYNDSLLLLPWTVPQHGYGRKGSMRHKVLEVWGGWDLRWLKVDLYFWYVCLIFSYILLLLFLFVYLLYLDVYSVLCFFHFVHVTHVHIVFFLRTNLELNWTFFSGRSWLFHFLGRIVTTTWVISVTWIGIWCIWEFLCLIFLWNLNVVLSESFLLSMMI